MLTLKQIREDKQRTLSGLALKGFAAESIIEEIISLDDQRKALQLELERNLSEQNRIAKEIGVLFKQGNQAAANELKEKVASLKESSKVLDTRFTEAETRMNEKIVLLPNLPYKLVPAGKTAEDNVVVKTGGLIPELSSEALPHWELAKKYDIIDFELGVKLTGAGFPVYKAQGARLQRALINFFLDEARKAGY
ncbi:MAG: serine--tRNA ligase, partial [Bacteroidales bacterium]|nr:serine--tRNA ligase [Bacteroidales bacterium]